MGQQAQCAQLLRQVEAVAAGPASVANISLFGQLLKQEARALARSTSPLPSSNLPYYAAIWDCAVVMSSERLYGLLMRLNGDVRPEVVALDTGRTCWIKVSAMSLRRFRHEVSVDASGAGDGTKLSLLRSLGELAALALCQRHPPHVCLYLSQIPRDEGERALGLSQTAVDRVWFAGELPTVGDAALERLLKPSPSLARVGDELNLDVTVLFALVSDICNDETVAPAHTAIIEQRRAEIKAPVVPDLLSLLSGRLMTINSDAYRVFCDIMQPMASERERKRAECLFKGPSGAVDTLNEMSIHVFPQTLRLPIRVVEYETGEDDTVPECLRNTNARSTHTTRVFRRGWELGLGTVSANRFFYNQLRLASEVCGFSEGCHVYLHAARSLHRKREEEER